MKKITIILIFASFNLFGTDVQKDKIDYYVHGQPLNDSLLTINRFMCFIRKRHIRWVYGERWTI